MIYNIAHGVKLPIGTLEFLKVLLINQVYINVIYEKDYIILIQNNDLVQLKMPVTLPLTSVFSSQSFAFSTISSQPGTQVSFSPGKY